MFARLKWHVLMDFAFSSFLVLHCPVFLAPPLFLSLSLSLLLSVSFYVSLSRGWIAIASRNPLSAGVSPEETAEEEVAAALCTRRQRTLGSWMKFAFRQWSTATTLICMTPEEVERTLQGESCGRPGLGNPSHISQVRIYILLLCLWNLKTQKH